MRPALSASCRISIPRSREISQPSSRSSSSIHRQTSTGLSQLCAMRRQEQGRTNTLFAPLTMASASSSRTKVSLPVPSLGLRPAAISATGSLISSTNLSRSHAARRSRTADGRSFQPSKTIHASKRSEKEAAVAVVASLREGDDGAAMGAAQTLRASLRATPRARSATGSLAGAERLEQRQIVGLVEGPQVRTHEVRRRDDVGDRAQAIRLGARVTRSTPSVPPMSPPSSSLASRVASLSDGDGGVHAARSPADAPCRAGLACTTRHAEPACRAASASRAVEWLSPLRRRAGAASLPGGTRGR